MRSHGLRQRQPQASATACTRVRGKFEQITGRDVPCEVTQVTCPCADPAVSPSFAQVLAGQIPIDSCEAEPFGHGTSAVDPNLVDGVAINGFDSSPAFSILFADSGWRCGPFSEAGLSITAEQGLYCAQLLEEKANSVGLTCGPFAY